MGGELSGLVVGKGGWRVGVGARPHRNPGLRRPRFLHIRINCFYLNSNRIYPQHNRLEQVY